MNFFDNPVSKWKPILCENLQLGQSIGTASGGETKSKVFQIAKVFLCKIEKQIPTINHQNTRIRIRTIIW
jgi:hypothetical protein